MVEGPSGKSFHVTTMQGCHRTRDLPREIENRTGRSRQENLEVRLKRCDFSLQVASTGNCLLHSRELSSGPWCKNRLTLRSRAELLLVGFWNESGCMDVYRNPKCLLENRKIIVL